MTKQLKESKGCEVIIFFGLGLLASCAGLRPSRTQPSPLNLGQTEPIQGGRNGLNPTQIIVGGYTNSLNS
jgi:hypothetical protein